MTDTASPITAATCAECGQTFDAGDVAGLDNLWERVEPGQIMPAGLCPADGCNGQCYLELAPIVIVVEGGVVQDILGILTGVKIETRDYDDDDESPDGKTYFADAEGDVYRRCRWS